jgi:signal transduction histidine kinase
MIARIEAGSPDGAMSEIDASATVHDVAELYQPVAEEKGIELGVDTAEPIRMKASRELLGQALANLIDNAIKYAGCPEDKTGPPRIAVSTSRQGNDLVVRVADNGPGIPAADRERVLQRFVRLEASRSQPGSGLGLSLVAAVGRLHHGTIELDDGNPGLVVTMRLPIA